MCDYCAPPLAQRHPVQVNYDIPLKCFSVSLFLLGLLANVADCISDGKLCHWLSTALFQRLDTGRKSQSVWNLVDSSWVSEPNIHLGSDLFEKKRAKTRTAAATADSQWLCSGQSHGSWLSLESFNASKSRPWICPCCAWGKAGDLLDPCTLNKLFPIEKLFSPFTWAPKR